MDHHSTKGNKKQEGDTTLSDRRYATKLFRGYRGTKSAGTCINAEKMRG